METKNEFVSTHLVNSIIHQGREGKHSKKGARPDADQFCGETRQNVPVEAGITNDTRRCFSGVFVSRGGGSFLFVMITQHYADYNYGPVQSSTVLLHKWESAVISQTAVPKLFKNKG